MGQRSKLENRQCLPRGLGKISPSGLIPACCSARAYSARAVSLSASGSPCGVRTG